MYEITTRTTFPYSAICYIKSTFPDGTVSTGSGTVVGVNDVLTAHHVVYQEEWGGWATIVQIFPGADTKPTLLTPYGSFYANDMYSRSSNWDTNSDGLLSDAEAQWDIALLSVGTAIGNTVGSLGLTSYSNDFYGTMLGYPGRGTGMMAENVFADASTRYAVYDIDSGLGAGASGGPLIVAGSDGVKRVAGVLSSGAANDSYSTYAALYGTGTWDWLTGVMKENDSSVPVLPPPKDDYSDSLQTTGTLKKGTYTFGAIETTGDIDAFKVYLSAGTYIFEAKGAGSSSGTLVDPFLTLYNSSGTQLASNDDSGTGYDSLLRYTISTSGYYYVGVEDSGNNTGTYRVTYNEASLDPAPGVFVGHVINGVDLDYYTMIYTDVARAGVDPAAHYHNNGWKEGRNPNDLFDTIWYLAMNPDVAAAGIDPLQHYRINGWKEDRDPSPVFDTSSYLEKNPDVDLAGMCPLDHYLYSGYTEGRLL